LHQPDSALAAFAGSATGCIQHDTGLSGGVHHGGIQRHIYPLANGLKVNPACPPIRFGHFISVDCSMVQLKVYSTMINYNIR
jgi:hypothetical protein